MDSIPPSPIFGDPRAVLKTWLDRVNSGDVETVLGLYSENAVLLPTFSSRQFVGREEIRKYFEILESKNNLHVDVRQRTLVDQVIGGGHHQLSGIYSWRFDVEEETLNFEARFTFLMRLEEGTPPIRHHHSSEVPRML